MDIFRLCLAPKGAVLYPFYPSGWAFSTTIRFVTNKEVAVSDLRVIQIVLVPCPGGCGNEIAYGVQRCPVGHWIYWGDKDAGVLASLKKDLPRLPQIGTVDFRGKYDLHALLKPEDGAEFGPSLAQDQRVRVIGFYGEHQEYYQLEDLGYVHHGHVILRGTAKFVQCMIAESASGYSSLDRPVLGAAIVHDLQPGTIVTIFLQKDGFAMIGSNEWVWSGFLMIGTEAKVTPIADGYQKLDQPVAGAHILNNLKSGSTLWVFGTQNGFLRVGPNEWVWEGFVEVIRKNGAKRKKR
jgi:hypothetical protein